MTDTGETEVRQLPVPQRFLRFAEREARGSSPLYEALCLAIAEEPWLIRLADRARPGQPTPNMLLGAVHYLLLTQFRDHPLARYYPSLTDSPGPPGGAFPHFLDFCREHEPALRRVLASHVVNTNEVQRCACLLPAFAEVIRRAGEHLHLIEIGAAAGLNLLWDRYAYLYDGQRRAGALVPGLTLECRTKGLPPPLPRWMPRIGQRIGIDTHPVDVHDPHAVAWLRALVWPEHRDRVRRLKAAVTFARTQHFDLLTGDGVALLPGVVESLPDDGVPVVYHSFTLNQLAHADRRVFEERLGELAELRPLFRIGLEWSREAAPGLELAGYGRGFAMPAHRLADCDAHGAWIAWRE